MAQREYYRARVESYKKYKKARNARIVRTILIIVAVLILAAAAYVTLTFDGAVRLAVVLRGYPLEAMQIDYMLADVDPLEEGRLYELTPHIKNRENEGGFLTYWTVKKTGPFYSCSYTGMI